MIHENVRSTAHRLGLDLETALVDADDLQLAAEDDGGPVDKRPAKPWSAQTFTTEKAEHFLAFVGLASALICYRRPL